MASWWIAMPLWFQIVCLSSVLVHGIGKASAGPTHTSANLVYHIDRRLARLTDAALPPDAILRSLNDIVAEVGGWADLVSAIAQRAFVHRPDILDWLRRSYPLQYRAVPPGDSDLWPVDPTILFDLLLGGHRFDMGQYLARVRLPVAHLAVILPFLENRDVRVAVNRFMEAGWSATIADLLTISVFRDELCVGASGLYAALDAMHRDDVMAFEALIWHRSAIKWINRRIWIMDDTILHIAVRSDKLWAVDRLCQVPSIDLRALNHQRETALDLAQPDSETFNVLLHWIAVRHRRFVESRFGVSQRASSRRDRAVAVINDKKVIQAMFYNPLETYLFIQHEIRRIPILTPPSFPSPIVSTNTEPSKRYDSGGVRSDQQERTGDVQPVRRQDPGPSNEIEEEITADALLKAGDPQPSQKPQPMSFGPADDRPGSSIGMFSHDLQTSIANGSMAPAVSFDSQLSIVAEPIGGSSKAAPASESKTGVSHGSGSVLSAKKPPSSKRRKSLATLFREISGSNSKANSGDDQQASNGAAKPEGRGRESVLPRWSRSPIQALKRRIRFKVPSPGATNLPEKMLSGQPTQGGRVTTAKSEEIQRVRLREPALTPQQDGFQKLKMFILSRTLFKQIAMMGGSEEITPNQKGILKDLVVNQNSAILAAADLFVADGDLDELKDTLIHLSGYQ